MPAPRTIAFVLFENALALDVTGPAEVFSTADRLTGNPEPAYRLVYLSARGGLVGTTCGLALQTRPCAEFHLEGLDTMIVVGGPAAAIPSRDTELIAWIRRASRAARRTCSICTGAFLLAAAGLLDGRRAVTHWSSVEALRARYPEVRVELDPIYVQDGDVWTSAGVTAGIDLALALVEADAGRRLSLAIAKELVVYLHRSGGQAQFSRMLAVQTGLETGRANSGLDDLHLWIADHLGEDLAVERLAALAGMAPRTFARKFVDRYACTPAKLVEDLRIEAASRHLEEGDATIKQIALACGFGDEERMRRAFMRRMGIPPAAYRDRFAARHVSTYVAS